MVTTVRSCQDPGSILAIVSMRIRTGWLGHSNQVHIPTIAKVSDPSAVKTCKGTMIFPRTICSLEKRLCLLSRHEPAQTWNKNTFHQIQGDKPLIVFSDMLCESLFHKRAGPYALVGKIAKFGIFTEKCGISMAKFGTFTPGPRMDHSPGHKHRN